MSRCENVKSEYWDYYENFIDDSDKWFDKLKQLPLKSGDFTTPSGDIVPTPRISAYYVCNKEGKFDVLVVEELARLVEKKLSEKNIDVKFNGALIHMYRDGKDHIGWHSDREATETYVVGISFGSERKFKIRRVGQKKGWLWEANLKPGSCLIQRPGMQKRFQHMIMKTSAKNQPGPRISVTLRRDNKSYQSELFKDLVKDEELKE